MDFINTIDFFSSVLAIVLLRGGFSPPPPPQFLGRVNFPIWHLKVGVISSFVLSEITLGSLYPRASARLSRTTTRERERDYTEISYRTHNTMMELSRPTIYLYYSYVLFITLECLYFHFSDAVYTIQYPPLHRIVSITFLFVLCCGTRLYIQYSYL